MNTPGNHRPNTRYEIKRIVIEGAGLLVEFYDVDPATHNAVLMPELGILYADIPDGLNQAIYDALGALELVLGPKHEERDGSKEMHARRLAELIEAQKRRATAELEIQRLEMIAIEKKAALDDMDRQLAANSEAKVA